MPQTKIHLSPAMFGETEKILAESGPFRPPPSASPEAYAACGSRMKWARW